MLFIFHHGAPTTNLTLFLFYSHTSQQNFMSLSQVVPINNPYTKRRRSLPTKVAPQKVVVTKKKVRKSSIQISAPVVVDPPTAEAAHRQMIPLEPEHMLPSTANDFNRIFKNYGIQGVNE